MAYSDLPDPNKKSILKKFVEKWNRFLQPDKQEHLFLGFLVGTGGMICYLLGYLSLPACVFLVNLAGYGIEFAQSMTKDRCFEANDAYATVAGGTIPVLCLYVYEQIVRFLEAWL